MRRLHPPIHLLRAFVATARQSSMSRAAQELHLTQSAVSKQVLELEEFLGVQLFERLRNRIVLSPAGERFLPPVCDVLARLEQATLDVLAGGPQGGQLNVSTLPTFGAKWLIPRLPAFLRAHPGITVNFLPHRRTSDVTRSDADCEIRWGGGVWPGMVAHYLAGREVALVAPPGVRLRRLADVTRHELLQHSVNPTAWEQWARMAGVQLQRPLAGPQFEQVVMMVRAVSAGMGVALVPRCLVQEDIDSGFVADPLGKTWVAPQGYFLCYGEDKASLPAIAAFRDWLLAQADAPAGAARHSMTE